MPVERVTACMSRGLPAVFQITDSAPRETYVERLFLPAFHLYETAIIKSLNFEIKNGK
ncbi:MAG: hypothetical protein LBJ63_00485 [Prevotellaceae bacterium]|jgi:hypothetical protein|nr:hypothetical protein [Prevotellaceae bacterium]